jgi:hypothetical protein
MNPNETIGVLDEYDRGLKNLVRALRANQNRRDVVALMQELVNRDIGRILGLGLPPNWQGEDQELSQRIKSILEDIRKDAELAGAFVGQEDIPPTLDFLVSGIRLNVEARLHCTSGVTSAGKVEKTVSPAKKWWQLRRRQGE